MSDSGSKSGLGIFWTALTFGVPVLVTAAVVSVAAPASAVETGKRIREPKAVESVPVSKRTPNPPPADPSAADNMRPPAAPVWPEPMSTLVSLPGEAGDVTKAAAAASDAARAASGRGVAESPAPRLTPVPGSPLRIGRAEATSEGARLAANAGVASATSDSPAAIRAEVLKRDRGLAGTRPVVARLTRADRAAARAGAVTVSIDYAGFRSAYGGDWAGRLRLVRLPECALTTPEAPGCVPVELDGVNDLSTSTVSATVTLAAAGAAGSSASALVALASGPESSTGGGTYAATPLQATSSWSAGGQSGDFQWSYPIRTPEAFGGPSPSVGLSYSSQSLDGKTAASNSQPSWAGEGFDYNPASVSRAYRPCVDDGKKNIGDLCWGTDNATLSMPGHAGELIQTSVNPDKWRLTNDDGTVIERLTGAVNGARNGEYWRVTTTDGVQYHYGKNRLPGWSDKKLETNSVFTVPVFGDDDKEPCYNADFAKAWCVQAYTWHLDYVVDPHGNSMSLWYSQEKNHYARNVTASAVSEYTRGGHLDRIDYGTRTEDGVDSVYSVGEAPARVVFEVEDRCLTAGATCVKSTPSNWPDVPWEQQCDSTTSCADKYTPVFFSQKRLRTITTRVWSGTGSTYRDVERWTLKYAFKDPGDNRAKILWLSKLSHEGLDGATTTVPDVSFNAVPMNNRVDTATTKNPIVRYRISSIVNESGGVVAVTYSKPECVLGSKMPATAESNTMLCYPVYWTPYGAPAATFDWFHKYVVTGVTVSDPIGNSAPRVTTYQYLDSPAWHYDDAELVPPAHRSWGQWRGYSKVRTLVGSGDTARQQTDEIFFRGMHGDKFGSTTRSVQLPEDPDFGGGPIDDEPWRRGKPRERIEYNGVGDTAPVISKTMDTPWEYGPTATRDREGVVAKAYVTDVRSTTTKVSLGEGRWRTTLSTNTFDSDIGLPDPFGRIVKVDNANDVDTTLDDRCTTSTYATDPNGMIRNAVAEAVEVAVACSVTPDPATDVMSDLRTWYDGAETFDKIVKKGDVTTNDHVVDPVTGKFRVKSRGTYDKYGRIRTSTDVLGNTTTTTYAPDAGALPTTVTTTNSKGWIDTVTMNPAYGLPLSKVDPNGARTDLEYDGMGRLTAVWYPGRPKAGGKSASERYTYVIGGSGGASSIATSKLNTAGDGYLTGYKLFDGELRERQTQIPAPGGGAILTDTLYDSRGLAVQTNHPYFNSGVSWGDLYEPTSPVPGQTITSYDNAGRATAAAFQVRGVERWRSTTAYFGDHIETTVPAGDTAIAKYTNALGQVTELREYHGVAPSGEYDTTRYEYDKRGKTARVVNAAGSEWRFEYDQLGRNIRTVDPDRGTSEFGYDAADRQVTAKNARDVTLTTVYDELGRITDRYDGEAETGTPLVKTEYDTLAKGYETSTTRYVNGQEYTSAVTGYDAGYRVTGTKVTIPPSEGALAGEYVSGTTYHPNGAVATTTLPRIGGTSSAAQPEETITYGYNDLGMPTTLTGTDSYLAGTAYDPLGRVSAALQSSGGKELAQLWSYEDGTSRLVEHGVYDNKNSSVVFQDAYYGYDDAGNVTSIKDKLHQYGSGSDDNQCFRYDHQRRLTEAWTPTTGDCATDPTTAGLGGPAPYWQSFTYDQAGDRKSQTDHMAAGDTTIDAVFPAGQPHAITQATVTKPGGQTETNTYGYDATGNMTSRQVAGKPGQTLTWDAEGHLATVTDSAGTTNYLYDGTGSRLIARDSTGATLYVGPQELRVGTDGKTTTTRYYGKNAVRTSEAGLCWTTLDHHGTNTLIFNAATLAKTQRRIKPFGEVRGGNPDWPTSKGFVGGTEDPTGLTQLGARSYDPTLGRFISVDPLFDSGDPQTFNGYAYAHNNPLTASDPAGLADSWSWYYIGSEFWTTSGSGWKTYWEAAYFVLCRSDGQCAHRDSYWGQVHIDIMVRIYSFTVKVPIVYGPPAAAPRRATPRQVNVPFRPCTPPKPQAMIRAAKPTCEFKDIGCLLENPTHWLNGNKDWVVGGAALAGAVACTVASAGMCGFVGMVGWGISSSDRVYDFVNEQQYQSMDGWVDLAGGLAIDAAAARFPGVPGVRAIQRRPKVSISPLTGRRTYSSTRTSSWSDQFSGDWHGMDLKAVTGGFAAGSTQASWFAISAPDSAPWQNWYDPKKKDDFKVNITNPAKWD